MLVQVPIFPYMTYQKELLKNAEQGSVKLIHGSWISRSYWVRCHIIILLHAISQKTTFPINSLSFQDAKKIIHIKFPISREVQAFFWNPLFQFILHKCLKYVSLIKTSFAFRFFWTAELYIPILGFWCVVSQIHGGLIVPSWQHCSSAMPTHPSEQEGPEHWVLCFMSYYKCCDNWRFCINSLSYKILKKRLSL